MSAFTDQINAASPGSALTFCPGEYVVDQPVSVRNPLIFDPGAHVRIAAPVTMQSGSCWVSSSPVKHKVWKEGVFHTFNIAGSDVAIQDVSIDHASNASGWDFMFRTDLCGMERIDLKRIVTYLGTGLVADSGGNGIIVGLKMEDVAARQHQGRGSLLSKAWAYIHLTRCTIDYINTPNPAAANVPAWVFQNAQGLELSSVDVTGLASMGALFSQYGFYFENCEAVRLHNVQADNVGGFGFWMGNCQYVQGSTVNAALGGDIGFVLCKGTKDVFLENVYASGRAGYPSDTHAAMFYTDGTTSNINFGQTMTERVSGPVFTGAAQGSINFTRLVQR